MDEDLLPVTPDEQPSGFDVVLRGYDRRQVDDYLDRVEVALQEADARHAHDTARISARSRSSWPRCRSAPPRPSGARRAGPSPSRGSASG